MSCCCSCCDLPSVTLEKETTIFSASASSTTNNLSQHGYGIQRPAPSSSPNDGKIELAASSSSSSLHLEQQLQLQSTLRNDAPTPSSPMPPTPASSTVDGSNDPLDRLPEPRLPGYAYVRNTRNEMQMRVLQLVFAAFIASTFMLGGRVVSPAFIVTAPLFSCQAMLCVSRIAYLACWSNSAQVVNKAHKTFFFLDNVVLLMYHLACAAAAVYAVLVGLVLYAITTDHDEHPNANHFQAFLMSAAFVLISWGGIAILATILACVSRCASTFPYHRFRMFPCPFSYPGIEWFFTDDSLIRNTMGLSLLSESTVSSDLNV